MRLLLALLICGLLPRLSARTPRMRSGNRLTRSLAESLLSCPAMCIAMAFREPTST